jgi:cytochrome c5
MRPAPDAVLAIVAAVALAGCGSAGGSAAEPGPAPVAAALAEQLGAEERAAIGRFPADPGHELVEADCLICHGAAIIQQQHKDSAAWTRTVTLMRRWGAPVADEQVPAVLGYLMRNFGVASRQGADRPSTDPLPR